MTELLPGIGTLDKGSLCYSIYSQLYHNFFYAQDAGTIMEGDQTSVRLHNTAYNFASAISSGVNGEGDGESGGILLDYLRKTGDDMRGSYVPTMVLKLEQITGCCFVFQSRVSIYQGI